MHQQRAIRNRCGGAGLILSACLLGLGDRAGDTAPWPRPDPVWTRNPVSAERGLPETFDPRTGHNVKWVVPLGTEAHGNPTVGSGRVLIGTNNNRPRDERHLGDRGVLFCLNETDGALLWQLVVPKRVEDIYFDWPHSGICSPPVIEGDRAYVVDNRGVVLCLDLQGLGNGNDGPFRLEEIYYAPQPTNDLARGAPAAFAPDGTLLPDTPAPHRIPPGPLDADILWMFDLSSGAGIWSHDAAHSGVVIYGDHLYLNTGTGVDHTHRRIPRPEAPGLVVLNKHTGRLLARERSSRGNRIFHSTWAPPVLGLVRGQPRVIFAGGDAVLRAFEPLPPGARPTEPVTLRQVWEFDFDPTAPKEDIHRYHLNRRQSPSNIYGAPVLHADRVYVAGGGDFWWGKNEAWLKCIDATGTGDLTVSGLVWAYPLGKHVFATPAVCEGLVYIGDTEGVLHCVDAAAGRAVWTHEAGGDFWASPLVADGKVYVGTRRGEFLILRAGREKQVLHTVSLGAPISATAVAANGVLYVTTMNRLFALAVGATAPAGPES